MLYKRSPWAIIFAGLVFAALNTCGTDKDLAASENRAYCEAVDLWRDSGHEYGHPDYRDIYDGQCKN